MAKLFTLTTVVSVAAIGLILAGVPLLALAASRRSSALVAAERAAVAGAV